MMTKRVIVIGGGPSGMIAAAEAAKSGHSVTIIERSEKLGKKLFLTGKGRCNITNDAETEALFSAVQRNPKFLFAAFNAFTNRDIVALLEGLGVPTKVERGGRVFPVSDKSSDVLRALAKHVERCGVKVMLNTRVKAIEKNDDVFTVRFFDNTERVCDALILCTGGKSYPSTGSSGDGYAFAKGLGHTIVEPKPSLIPFVTVEDWPPRLQGLTLKNVTLTAYNAKNKKIYSELGEMLFTHFGVSGPLVLTLSTKIADAPEGTRMFIDLKPALTAEMLDKRVLSDFSKNTKKQLKNVLTELMPSQLIAVILELCGISGETTVDQVTKAAREKLCEVIKAIPLTVRETLPIDEAIITRGGVTVKEINPSTMESKLCPGLFFAGEVIDVDAQTGGFNLQIAYSTGYLAGHSV